MTTPQAHAVRRKKVVSAARDERIAARIPAEQKELLRRAAAIRGSSLTDFIIAAARDAATQTIREHEVITLSERDSRAFIEALLHPEPANETLRMAAERYKARMGDQ